MHTALFVVLAFTVATAVGAWVYFRRARIDRPPIGVVNLRDAIILIVALVLMPYLYLWLPLAVVTTFLVVIVLTGLRMTLEPMLPHRVLLWGVCLGLVAADVALGISSGVSSAPFLLLNNVVLTIIVLGVANLWAQSGMKAREVAVLAGALAVYDVIATWQLSVMTDVFERLSQLPLVPVVGWGTPDSATALRLGLGDLLLLTVTPLVLRKAFGRTAGMVALGSGLAAVTILLVLLNTQTVTVAIPVMAVLGPLIVGQYWYWRKTHRTERRTWEYLRAEPLTLSPAN